MSRNISKRIELNDLEAKTLKMKADQCHLSESDYLRELIMNSQPVEAPPRQFYEQMEKVNRIASTIQRICATAQDKAGIDELKSLYVQLIGHIVIGTMMVDEKIRTLAGFPPKLANELKHCIVAHHGELEYGSPKKPALIEALALNYADNTDAKLESFMEALAEENTQQGEWRGYNKLFDSNIRETGR